jgi:hypothetical protein
MPSPEKLGSALPSKMSRATAKSRPSIVLALPSTAFLVRLHRDGAGAAVAGLLRRERKLGLPTVTVARVEGAVGKEPRGYDPPSDAPPGDQDAAVFLHGRTEGERNARGRRDAADSEGL